MSIGERIYTARQEAGLSQRELAGENITRNMLSLLEHDQANPSLETLRYLSQRLNRPVSFFLGEDSAYLPGLEELMQARAAFREGRYFECLELLESAETGEILKPEREMLWAEATLREAEQALEQGKDRYCHTILERAGARMEKCPYAAREMEARRTVLMGRSAGSPQQLLDAAQKLPDVDEILMLQAQAALQREQPDAAKRALEAVENRESTRWNILRGDAAFGLEEYEEALGYYHQAEQEAPKLVRKGLQVCYAKLKNFEKAYEYATME